MSDNSPLLQSFYSSLKRIHTLKSVEGVLEWDQQVCLPPLGGPHRAEQLTALASIVHAEQTNPRLAEITRELSVTELDEDDAVNVRETLRVIERAQKIPARLVEEKAKATANTYQEWVQVRPTGDFKKIERNFSVLLSLVKEEAACTAVSQNPYDALLDLYEPGGRIDVIGPLLSSCANSIVEMLPDILKKQSATPADTRHYDRASQEKLTRKVAADLGFSFESGRLDTAPHPFQTTLGPGDFRITTRWDESEPFSALFGVIHEVGHALYEMGLKEQWVGTPMGSPVSLGIHESQSRFWENMIGRSVAFSQYLVTQMNSFFPNHRHTAEDLWALVNGVEPTLIRVEADEVTYTLHVVIRMQLEEQLINEKISVRELPEAWRELYRNYLGVESPDDRDGVLQDVHWYSGSFGYFPTYALGNLYAALFREKMTKDIGDFNGDVAKGRFGAILEWLNKNVHEHGMRYRGPDLAREVTGENLSAEPFIRYLRSKFV